jgi:hypothetical protein
MVYKIRLAPQVIYEWRAIGVAGKLFGNSWAWLRAMREQTGALHEQMARVARMIEGHMEGILAHWARGLTTAFIGP